jgi:hypothetical protein
MAASSKSCPVLPASKQFRCITDLQPSIVHIQLMHGAMSITMILLVTLHHSDSSQMRVANKAPGPQPAVHGLLLCTGGSLALSVQRLLQLRLQRQANRLTCVPCILDGNHPTMCRCDLLVR